MKKPLKYTSAYWDYLDWEHEQNMAELARKRAISDSHPQEAIRPMTWEEKAIFKYKSHNLIPNNIEVTIDDVLYEECGTDRNKYLQRVNAFCGLDSVIPLAIRNGKKRPV